MDKPLSAEVLEEGKALLAQLVTIQSERSVPADRNRKNWQLMQATKFQLEIWLQENAAELIAAAEREQWQPIETAPRDGTRILVFYDSETRGPWVQEAWWRTPYEAALLEQCSWCYHWTGNSDGCLLDKSIHGIGASKWKPLPPAPETGAQTK